MTGPTPTRLRRFLVIIAGICCAAISLAGSPALAPPPAPPTIKLLQLNLCNSGMAGCYTGRAVAHAATLLATEAPNVVSLNEICEDDVGMLAAALRRTRPDGEIVTGFEPAFGGRTGRAVVCHNGERFGIGLLVRAPSDTYQRFGGLYPMQVTRGEQRVWLCLETVALFACSTHLANGGSGVALAQCRHLLENAIPTRNLPVVVAGDLNLGTADASPCLPTGYTWVGDGAVQHVMAGPELAIASSRTIDLAGVTDHPGLLLTLQGAEN